MGVSKGAAGAAIRQIESSGNYSARGPTVKTGRYAGERAMGAYQVMPGNLPQWSKAALGRVVSEQEFMSSRAIQDQIFDHQFGNSMKRHGFADAASIWHSGSNLAAARKRGATDGYSTTVDYVNKASGYFGGSVPVSQNARNGTGFSAGAADTSTAGVVQSAQPQMSAAQHKANKFAEDVKALGELRNVAHAGTSRRNAIGKGAQVRRINLTPTLKSGV